MERGREGWLWRRALAGWYPWQCPAVLSTLSSWAASTSTTPGRTSIPTALLAVKPAYGKKYPTQGSGFSFDDGSEKLLLRIGWGKVLSVDSVLAKHFTGFG